MTTSGKWWPDRALSRSLVVSVILHGLIAGAGRLQAIDRGAAKKHASVVTVDLRGVTEIAVVPPCDATGEQTGTEVSRPAEAERRRRSGAGTLASPPAATNAARAVERHPEGYGLAIQNPVDAGEESPVLADQWRQYRLKLAVAARKTGRHADPALAVPAGGEVATELSISGDGSANAPRVSVVRSSGLAAIDARAAEMLAGAANVVDLPESLRFRPFSLSVTVRFSPGE